MKAKLMINVVPLKGKPFTAIRVVEIPHVCVGMELWSLIPSQIGSNPFVVIDVCWNALEPEVMQVELQHWTYKDHDGDEFGDYEREAIIAEEFCDWQINELNEVGDPQTDLLEEEHRKKWLAKIHARRGDDE